MVRNRHQLVGNSRYAVFGARESDQIGQSGSAFFGLTDDVEPKRQTGNISMNKEGNTSSIILVVEDINETRDGIEKLLKADGYRVTLARDERDAIESAQREPPNLILVSVAGLPREVVIAARQIREVAGLEANVPVVVFCIAEIDEGAEVAIGQNVYITRPDNFNQLRTLLARLLNEIPIAA